MASTTLLQLVSSQHKQLTLMGSFSIPSFIRFKNPLCKEKDINIHRHPIATTCNRIRPNPYKRSSSCIPCFTFFLSRSLSLSLCEHEQTLRTPYQRAERQAASSNQINKPPTPYTSLVYLLGIKWKYWGMKEGLANVDASHTMHACSWKRKRRKKILRYHWVWYLMPRPFMYPSHRRYRPFLIHVDSLQQRHQPMPSPAV